MKEVTYEEWQKNPTPRMMWVWDYDIKLKVIRKVVYVSSRGYFPVITVDSIGNIYTFWNCAEIEEPKTRLMTHKELAHWLREKPTREAKYSNYDDCSVFSTHVYDEDYGDKEVSKDIVIREDDSEWREPLVEE